jgi:hypothetical protein
MANGGGGALEAQQRIGAEIPYKNIALGNPADKFLNAWSMATQLRLKKSEIEGKMQALAERNRQLELSDDLKEKGFALREMMNQNAKAHQDQMYDLALRKFDLDSTVKDATMRDQQAKIDIQKERAETDKANSDLRYQKYEDLINAQGDLATLDAELEAEGLKKGTVTYQSEWIKRAGPALKKLPSAEHDRQWKLHLESSNADSDRESRIQERLEDSTRKNIGATLFGNAGITDFSFLDDPKSLPDERVATGAHWWQWTSPSTTPSGKKLVSSVDAAGRPVQKAVTLAEITKARKLYQDTFKDRSLIASKVDDPSVGVYATKAKNLKEQAQRLREDPGASPVAKAAAEKYLRENP